MAKIETGSTAAASKMRVMDELVTIDDVSVSPKTDSKLTAEDVHTRTTRVAGHVFAAAEISKWRI